MNENEWITPNSLKTVIDESKIGLYREEAAKKRQEEWDALPEEDKEFYIYNNTHCYFCRKKFEDRKFKREIVLDKITSKRKGSSRVTNTRTKTYYINECQECKNIHDQESKYVEENYFIYLLLIFALFATITYLIFNDVTIGLFVCIASLVPAVGISRFIAKSRAAKKFSGKDYLKSINDIPFIKRSLDHDYSVKP